MYQNRSQAFSIAADNYPHSYLSRNFWLECREEIVDDKYEWWSLPTGTNTGGGIQFGRTSRNENLTLQNGHSSVNIKQKLDQVAHVLQAEHENVWLYTIKKIPSLISTEWGRRDPSSIMEQSACPSHTGLVARPEDRLLLCATAEGFLDKFSVVLSTTNIS